MKLVMTLLVVGFCCCSLTANGQRKSAASAVEDITIARSLRTSRTAPSEFCAESRVGFGAITFEDRFTFHVVSTRAGDGKVTDAHGSQIGQIRTCFGTTANLLKINFYGEGTLSAVAFVGKGECEAPKPDFPEPGITVFRCYLELKDLPRGYVGGLLTTSTVVSRELNGDVSDPPGYVQSSVATVRFWKQR